MITVTLGDKPQQESKPFPKLMVGKNAYIGTIVFFSEESTGVALVEGNNCAGVGAYANNWPMNYFTDYNEPITIQNA